MKEIDYNGKIFYMKDELEPGEMELDLISDVSDDKLEDTIDLSEVVIDEQRSLEDTLTDMEKM